MPGQRAERESRAAPCAGSVCKVRGIVVSARRLYAASQGAGACDGLWRAQKAKFASEMREMRASLGAIGLAIREVRGDGNCLFRSVSDQLTGSEESHWELRLRAVAFMRAHRDDFEPFVDTDEHDSWEEYLSDMACEGEWGGNMELVALSRAAKVNVCVHQPDAPRWEVTHFSPRRRTIHVSYHDGSHYNSVRLAGDASYRRAAPFRIEGAGASYCECEEPPSDEEDAGGEGPGALDAAAERVRGAVGTEVSLAAAHAALEEAGGDEDGAVAVLAAASGGAPAKPLPAAGKAGKGRGMTRKQAKQARRRAEQAARLASAAAEGDDVEAARAAAGSKGAKRGKSKATASEPAAAAAAAAEGEEVLSASMRVLAI